MFLKMREKEVRGFLMSRNLRVCELFPYRLLLLSDYEWVNEGREEWCFRRIWFSNKRQLSDCSSLSCVSRVVSVLLTTRREEGKRRGWMRCCGVCQETGEKQAQHFLPQTHIYTCYTNTHTDLTIKSSGMRVSRRTTSSHHLYVTDISFHGTRMATTIISSPNNTNWTNFRTNSFYLCLWEKNMEDVVPPTGQTQR